MEDTKEHRLRGAVSATTARRRIKPPQNGVTQTRPCSYCFILTKSHTPSMIKYNFGSVKRNKSLPSQRYQTARCTHGQRKENLGTLTVSLQLLHIYQPTPPPASLWLCLTAWKNPTKVPAQPATCVTAERKPLSGQSSFRLEREIITRQEQPERMQQICVVELIKCICLKAPLTHNMCRCVLIIQLCHTLHLKDCKREYCFFTYTIEKNSLSVASESI